MEVEIESKIFMIDNYPDKNIMKMEISEYIKKLKNTYNDAIVTKEFYKGRNVLVRATKIISKSLKKDNFEKNYKLEKEEVKIKEKGINGLGENVYKIQNGRSKEKTGGSNGRERC